MSILQAAKDLLKKGMALQDDELILMANQLLANVLPEDDEEKTNKKAVKKTGRTKGVKKASRNKPPTTNPDHIDDDYSFRMDNNNSKILTKRKVRVKGSGRNKFVDDKTVGISEKEKTPYVKPVPRDRPKHKKVKKVCRDCKKPFVSVVGDGEIGEYKCNKCICGE